MRGLWTLLLTLAAVAAAASAAAAPTSDALIRPGKSIGKARLGMAEADVRRALGRPLAVVRKQLGFGRQEVEYQFADGHLFVHLRGPRSALRVVRVATLQRSERTAAGIGVGSRERALLRAYRGKLRCSKLETARHGGVLFVVADRTCALAAGAARTVFRIDGRVESTWDTRRWSRLEEWPQNARIVEVTVEVRT
jgi:hypothetical protein